MFLIKKIRLLVEEGMFVTIASPCSHFPSKSTSFYICLFLNKLLVVKS
uniref:Uncharacterized protein n=1 Tax=Lepeophtheirus salmonis TaxID=72036 RepID=A0A0K2TZ44_LEPSM